MLAILLDLVLPVLLVVLLLILRLLAANDLEAEGLLLEVVLVLAAVYQDFALRQIADHLLRCNAQEHVDELVVLVGHVLRDLVADNTAHNCDLAHDLATGGASQDGLLRFLFR